MKTIGEQWEDFRARAMPRHASPIQVSEMRRAFYAGANSLFGALMVGLDPESEPTDADMARMRAIQDELFQFVTDVCEGRA